MKPTLLIDRDFFPISIISWKKSFDLIQVRQCAEPIRVREGADVKSYYSVIRLLHRAIPTHIRTRGPRFSKHKVFERDRYICQYCKNTDRRKLTIDHIIPKSRGGPDSFLNCITCCLRCNLFKDDRTPEEAGMVFAFPVNFNKQIPMVGTADNYEEWGDFLSIRN